jgi:hypothetical protein
VNAKTLIPLVLVCGIFAYLGIQEPSKKKVSGALDDPNPFSSFDINSVTHLRLEKGEDDLSISRNEDQWRASQGELDYPIDPSKLVQVLRAVQDTQLLDLLANDRQYDKNFGLNKESKPSVLTLKAGEKTLIKLQLGKGRPGDASNSPYGFAPEQGQFLRYSESGSVYFAKEKIDAQIRASAWMNSELAKADKDEISKIELNYPEKTIALTKSIETKKDDNSDDSENNDDNQSPETITVWKAEGDLEALSFQSENIDDLLDNLKTITVSEPVPAHRSSQLNKANSYSLKTFRGDDLLYHLSFQKVDDDWLVWQGENAKEIYTISNLDNIFANNDKLFSMENIALEGSLTKASWEKDENKRSFQKIIETWGLTTSGEHPAAHSEVFDALTELSSGIEVLDVLPKAKGRKAKASLTMSSNTDAIMTIEDLGKAPFKSARVVRVDGTKIFMIPAASGDKLFPEETLESPETIDAQDVVSFSNGAISAQKDQEQWTNANGSELKDDTVNSWIEAFNAIVGAEYSPETSISGKTRSLTLSLGDEAKKVALLGQTKAGLTQVQLKPFAGTFQLDSNLAMILANGENAFLRPQTTPESADDASDDATLNPPKEVKLLEEK